MRVVRGLGLPVTLSKRLAGVVALLAVLAAAPAADAAKPKRPSAQAVNLKRAQLAFAAFQRDLYVPRYSLYAGHSSQAYSYAWPFSQALEATLSMSLLPRVGRTYMPAAKALFNRGLPHYWDASKNPPGYDGGVVAPLGDGGAIGYDDNEWIGIALARRYLRSKSRDQLARAEQVFDLAVYGWDRNPTHACPGGVLFSQDPGNTDRNTITNAPAAELGARLYLITRRRYYLDWAKRFFEWVRGCLEGPNGLFEDHLDFSGDIDPTVWSYNEGTMVGASALLYKATRYRGYQRHALDYARKALSWFTPSRITGDPSYFVGIFVDNLELLNEVTPFPSYRRVAQAYGDWAWANVRDSSNDLFPFDTAGGQVLEQAGMVRLYATLAGAPRY